MWTVRMRTEGARSSKVLLLDRLQEEDASLRTDERVAQSAFVFASNQLEGLQQQVVWDKSHLLDCWTVIARVVPRGTMPSSLEPLRHAARPTGSLSRWITSCASDALP